MGEFEIQFKLNGEVVLVTTEPHRTLLHLLRNELGLSGTKEACGQGDCGACVVVLDGVAVNSCLVLAPQIEDAEILTVEGLGTIDSLHPLQRWFSEKWAFQCGFCTPGMLMSAYALLQVNADPSPEEVRKAIAGNLCRCTSYQTIVEAVLSAAEDLKTEDIAMEAEHG